MKLTKLNDDSSWLWEFDSFSVLVDPWFTTQQVDLAPWFSKQQHFREQPQLADLPPYNVIFISHPFTDHCNKETLLQLPPDILLIAAPNVLRKIKSWHHFKHLLPLDEAPFEITRITKASIWDLVHHAFLIKSSNTALLYAPHGLKQDLKVIKVDILIGTSTLFKLPFFLGGTINLGAEKLIEVAKICEAKLILNTHDEQKLGSGLVEVFAKKKYVTAHPSIRYIDRGECIEWTQNHSNS